MPADTSAWPSGRQVPHHLPEPLPRSRHRCRSVIQSAERSGLHIAYLLAFTIRQAVAWAKVRRLPEVNEWKPMLVIDRDKRQQRPRGKAAIALGAA